MRLRMLAALAALLVGGASAQAPNAPQEQLRHVIGRWDTRTEFLNPDGSVARVVDGTYEFEWVVTDRLARGVSRIPVLGQASAVLFYLRPATRQIEMASVGADGQLWVMTGPDDAEVRSTADVPTTDGGRMRLRFTRFNVSRDRFESRMDYSTNGGATWAPGNRQVFVRRPS